MTMRVSLRAKACTELISPVRVVQVATIVSQKVAQASASVERRRRPRRRKTIIACSSAVAASQGMSEVFSTGSQPQ